MADSKRKKRIKDLADAGMEAILQGPDRAGKPPAAVAAADRPSNGHDAQAADARPALDRVQDAPAAAPKRRRKLAGEPAEKPDLSSVVPDLKAAGKLGRALGKVLKGKPVAEPQAAVAPEFRAGPKEAKAAPAPSSILKAMTHEHFPGAASSAEPAVSRQRSAIMGHGASAVVRWMGKSGFSFDEAKTACANYGATLKDVSIKLSLAAGAADKYGSPADLSTDQAAKLLKFKAKA